MNARLIKRILVALDASPDSVAALEAAARLAAALEAELQGIFIEDINLIRMARLPFTREVRFPLPGAQKMEEAEVEQQLRAQASHARRLLQRAAERQGLVWSFRVARGAVTGELLAAVSEVDFLVLGRVSSVVGPATRLGSTARSALYQSTRPVLLMHPGVDLERPVLLLYDESPASARALSLASYLARVSNKLRVFVYAEDEEAAARLVRQVLANLEDSGLELSFRHLSDLSAANLSFVLGLSAVELLVLANIKDLPPDVIELIAATLQHPVLMVR